jgi:hypothetical protein
MPGRIGRFGTRDGGLVALNVAALATLAFVTWSPGAEAQRVNRPRGDYTMVPAHIQGMPEAAMFIVDSSNQEMLVLRYDRSAKTIKFIGFRDLAADSRQAGGRGR